MEAKLNIYAGCESDAPVKTYVCRRLTFLVGSKIEVLTEKIAKLEKKKTKDATKEEIEKINEEQLELTVETLQAIFPEFTKEDFNGVDPIEYHDFCLEIGKATAQVVNRASKN